MYHKMSLEEAATYVYELVRDVMPHILLGIDYDDAREENLSKEELKSIDSRKSEFINSYAKALEKQVSGTQSKVIEYLPNIFETDEKFLNVRKKIMERMLPLSEKDPDSQVFTKTGVREKDCYRMATVMSSSVEKTFFGPTALTQLYTQKYLDRASEYFTILDKVGFKPFVYIRKRSDSSNGSLSRTSDMTIFQATLKRFSELLVNDPEKLYEYELATLLLSRIMPKSNQKIRMVEGENGISHEHDRTVRGDFVEEISHIIERDNLASGQHRAVCNVSDIERATQMITQQAIEACKYTYFTMMRYKPQLMELYYNCGYTTVVCTDATKFDQSISEVLMRRLYQQYSKSVKIMDLDKFRDNKHITWYNQSAKCVYSLNYLVKAHIETDKLELERKVKEGVITKDEYQEGVLYLDMLSEYNFVGGVDSGNPHVSHDGKMNMIGSLYTVFKYYFGVDLTPHDFSKNFFEIDYQKYAAAMRREGLEQLIVNCKGSNTARGVIVNSSDDNFFATTQSWVGDAYISLIDYCKQSVVRPFLLAEPDAEFLSQILISEPADKGRVKQIGNPGRKMQSRFVGEYSGRNSDGTFKDMVLATKDRDAELNSSHIGKKLLNILEECWKSEYGETHSESVNRLMSGVQIAHPVQDALAAVRISANWADKELERDPSKAYYRDDIVDEAHEETMNILFTNISPVQTYDLYSQLGELEYCCEQIKKFAVAMKDVLDYTKEAIAKGHAPEALAELYDFDGLEHKISEAMEYSEINNLKKKIEELRSLDNIKGFDDIKFK